MKKIILAATITAASVPAYAGTEQTPQMDVTVISQGTGGAATQFIVPAIFLAMLILLMSGGSAVPAS